MQIKCLLLKEPVTKCKRCGKILKNKKARQLGYGPSCYKKMLKSRERKLI